VVVVTVVVLDVQEQETHLLLVHLKEIMVDLLVELVHLTTVELAAVELVQ
tara:strand:+ start:177 stop:326 length:150 start_codon:yes stop_codon:yes gene_type:complete